MVAEDEVGVLVVDDDDDDDDDVCNRTLIVSSG